MGSLQIHTIMLMVLVVLFSLSFSLVSKEGKEALDGHVDITVALLEHLQVCVLVVEAHFF